MSIKPLQEAWVPKAKATFFQFADAPTDIVVRMMQIMHIFSRDAIYAAQSCHKWNKAYKNARSAFGDYQKSVISMKLSKLSLEAANNFIKTYQEHQVLKIHTLSSVVYSALGTDPEKHLKKAWGLGGNISDAVWAQSFLVWVNRWLFENKSAPMQLMTTVNHLIDSYQFEILFGLTSRILEPEGIKYAIYQLIEKKVLNLLCKCSKSSILFILINIIKPLLKPVYGTLRIHQRRMKKNAFIFLRHC